MTGKLFLCLGIKVSCKYTMCIRASLSTKWGGVMSLMLARGRQAESKSCLPVAAPSGYVK
jgi:hypothetical protein